MGVHVNYETQDTSLYTLYYNPTSNNILVDGWETFRDKLGFTTPVAQHLSQVLKGVQQSRKSVNWVAHSQGGGIYSEAVRKSGQDLSKNSVVFHSGANNQIVTNQHLKNSSINIGVKTRYVNSPVDLVPNIIGLNTINPIKIVGSIVSTPSLFSNDPRKSPHTLPNGWKPAEATSQGERP
jgi:hypothetical protein